MLFHERAISELRKYASQTFFYHYDGWPTDTLDEHSGHPLLCAESVVLTDLRFYGQAALNRLNELGLVASEVLSIDTQQRLGSAELEVAISLSESMGSPQRSRISYFYPSRELLPNQESMTSTPEADLFDVWNNKQATRQRLVEMGVPTPHGVNAESRQDVLEFMSQTWDRWILKSESSHPWILAEANDFETLEDFGDGHWVIEQVVQTPLGSPSPNLTWLISNDKSEPAIFLFAADQRINANDFSHGGNRFPTTLHPDLVEACQRSAAPVLEELRGIDSVIGIDFIFDQDWQPVVVDVNPRFNSCTFPGLAFDQLTFGHERVGIYTTINNHDYSTLSDIYLKHQQNVQWFSPLDSKGLLLFGPQGGATMTAFRALCIGEDDIECEAIHMEFLKVAHLKVSG